MDQRTGGRRGREDGEADGDECEGKEQPATPRGKFPASGPGVLFLETGDSPRRRGAEELDACGQTIRDMYVEARGEDTGLNPSSDMAEMRYARAIAASSQLSRNKVIG